MKTIIFHNNEHTNIIILEPDITSEKCRKNFKHIHTTSTSQYLNSRKNNKVTSTTSYEIHSSEQHYCIICIQIGTAQSQQITTLEKLLHTLNPQTYMPQCPLCLSHTHDINHFFNCSQVPTQHNIMNL